MAKTETITVTVDTTPAEVLRAAAKFLKRHRWGKGSYHKFTYDNEGNRRHELWCAVGAMREVTGYDTDLSYSLREVIDKAQACADRYVASLNIPFASSWYLDGTLASITGYNDRPDTRKADVISALENAAESCEAQANT